MPLRLLGFLFLLLAFVPSASVAQLTIGPLLSAPNTGPTYPLDGVVINSATGLPIRAALVWTGLPDLMELPADMLDQALVRITSG